MKREFETQLTLDNRDKIVADYLVDLTNPEDRVREGLNWLLTDSSNNGIAGSPRVVNVILKNLPSVLSKLDALRLAQKDQTPDTSS